jgi:hypothetical protein
MPQTIGFRQSGTVPRGQSVMYPAQREGEFF